MGSDLPRSTKTQIQRHIILRWPSSKLPSRNDKEMVDLYIHMARLLPVILLRYCVTNHRISYTDLAPSRLCLAHARYQLRFH